MMATLPTTANAILYRENSGQTISFEHTFTPADVTEAYLYIRDEIDGELFLSLKWTDVAAQFTISDGTGSVEFIPSDLEDIPDGNYVYDIKLFTASERKTFQRGIINIVGNISID